MTALRLLGAVLVSVSGAACGFALRAALQKRAQVLAALCAALEQLRTEIIACRTPLRGVVQLLRESAAPCLRTWLDALAREMDTPCDLPFAQRWRRALETQSALPLRREELECLALLGLSLGRYDAPEQAAAIDRCLRETERFATLAREELHTKGKLFTGLGLALGALLAVVLL